MYKRQEQEPPVGSLFLFFLGIFPKKCIIELCGGGGTADTHASGACARTGVRVQIPSSASKAILSIMIGFFLIMEKKATAQKS